MPPKVSLVTEEHSDDEELATVEGDHDDDDDEVDDDESDTSRGDESSSHDPRLSLATTATMSTFITETDVSTESDSDEDAPKRHRPRRLVSPIAALLLPRSSRHALSCAVGLILITMCCATVASLSLMDNYFTGIATQFTLTLTDMQSVDTEATLAAVEATFAAAAVSGGDDTLVQRFVSTAATLSAAVQTTLLGAGVGEDSANLSDRSFASFWNGVRAAASTTPPTIGADLLECVNSSVAAAQLELQRLQQRRIANVAAYTTPTKLGDLVIAALGAVAGIDTGLVGVSDIDLATAAARSNTPSWTVAAVTGVVQPVELNTALAAGLFYSTADAGTQLPVLNALLPLSSAAQLVSPTSGASSDQVGLDPTTVQRAVVTYQWIITANTTLGRLSSFINALNANVKTIPTTVTPLATALLNASVALSALASAVDASSTANGVSPALAAWFSTMPLRAAAYGFNDTALALLSVQGLDMPAQSKFPWLLGQISSNQSRVAAWFGAPPAQPTGATCVASLGNVASQSNATAQWMKGALLTYSNGILSGVEDSDLTRPARRGLIATLVVCMAGVVVISLYGQWGVATRLSSSTLPYRSFVSLWWVSSLLLMGCIAWVTGLGLAECDVSDPRNLPRAAYSQPQAAQYKSSKAWTAEIFNAMTTVFSWTSTPTYVQLNTARATASDVPRPTAAFSFLRSVVEPFVGNATGGDPYSPQQVWSSLAEDDLLLEPTIQYVLRTGAPVSQSWLPPTMAASATGNSTSRGTSACALAFAARAVRLSWLLSTNVGAATVSAPTYAPTATSAAVQRARALAINWPNLDAAFTGVHQQRCLGVGNVADQAGLVQAAGVVDSVVTRGSQRFGVLASAQVDATGRVLWSQLSAALPLRNILVQQDAVTSQALNVLTQGLDSNFTSTVSGMVDSTLQRAVPLKRRVVWGHIGVCVCAQLIVLGLWRLLFGVSPTPF